MANNIKIVGNIVSTTTIPRYSSQDAALISSRRLQENFGGTGDYIEYFTYDIGGNLLNFNYNYLSYKLPSTTGLTPGISNPPNTRGEIQTTDVGIDSTLATPTSSLFPIIEIDPVKDLQNLGYSSGEFSVQYNFFQNKISDYLSQGLFVKTISQDRTEIALASTTLTNEQIESGSLALIDKINNSDYYVDYLLNFGDNTQYVAVNVALNPDPGGYEILFKLYQPLPLSVQEKQTLWIVEEKVTPYVFTINLDLFVTPPPPPQLRGPNFNIQIENQGTVATSYGSYNNLITNLKTLQSSSYNQIQNLLVSQSIDINIDYTNFDNFVFFGSAEQRVKNFYTKVKEIEDYQNFINKYTPFVATTASLQTNINQYSASISNIISNFDGYEYYLYFESSSYTWPKSSINKPFILLSTGSATVINWYNALTGSAETYDLNNYDNLEYAVPTFIKDDGNNAPFLTFLNMVGHYFDNIWIYIGAITDINLANNNLEKGISKDLVYQQLKSLGVKLYNSQAGNSVADYLIGANTGSSVFDNNFTITGSYLNNIPRADLVAELYKRIYHNLPLLLKTKGTVAGLNYLMTTFGIPNQTYYTIYSGSNAITYYIPTGSAATASILNVKEFGGSLKSGLIKGYNNDKVRIVINTITGSVLSSELSLQTFPTASSAFRDDDLHYIDISFSPETQIDTYISGAISSNNPTWVLDNYIGDPRQQYSASYPDLDTQRKLYFETGVTGYPGFTGSLLDYNGFIRLIEYFDNSLFKMLADFIPERASLSTGVTINSPVLERNKVVYSVPNAYTQSVYDANYDPTAISAQYGQLYVDLQGDKSPFFTGELSGSVIDVNQYFEDDFNPYDGDWNVWNLQHTISESINLNSFLHSDWNVLLNNVSKSVVSNIRQDIEYVYGTTRSILTPAELQDSYLSLRSYNTSRYDGAKITSLLYNTYTSGSYTGSDGRTIVTGDKSYGKTAAIDLNSLKVAWVKNIPSQSLNFYDKTSINLKYLVDASNNLTELSRANLNLPEVQRTFQSGDPVVLSISDVKVPSNQTTLDGTKTIWKGGFSYDPILFRENNETLNFTHASPISSSVVNLGIKAFCRDNYSYIADKTNKVAAINAPPDGGTTNDPITGYKWEINGIDGATTLGKPMAQPAYTFTSWKFKNDGNKVNFTLPPRSSMGIPSTSNYRIGGDDSQRNTNPDYNNVYVYPFDLLNFNNYSNGGYNTEPNTLTYTTQSGSPNNVYKVPRTGTYIISGSIPFVYTGNDEQLNGVVVFKPVVVVERCPVGADITDDLSWKFLEATTLSTVQQRGVAYSLGSFNTLAFSLDNRNLQPYGYQVYNLKVETQKSLIAGEYIRFRFYIIDISNAMGKNNGKGTKFFQFFINGVPSSVTNVPTLNRGFFQIFDPNTTVTLFEYNSSYEQVPQLFTTSSVNTLLFSPSASYLFTTSSTFTPQLPTSQYYSPVTDTFGLQKYDLVRIGAFNSPASTYYEITNISSSINGIYVTLSGNINTGSFITNIAQDFAIFRPKPDETSVIINFKKQPGEVSQTILIPNDANNVVKNAVGNIFKTLNPDLQ
jgi:hypothetical protein